MDKLTRKELKTDKFAEQVEHTVEYVAEHRKAAVRYTIAALVVLVAGLSFYFYSQNRKSARQEQLREALRMQQAAVGEVPNPFILSFKTEAEKDTAVDKAFNDIINTHGGSKEAAAAEYMLAVRAADHGEQAEAEKRFKAVHASGEEEYASMAALALADIYSSQGKTDEAEKLIRPLLQNPTIFVSKEQATVALAEIIGQKNPEEARRLLEPLRTERSAVSRAALNALAELPPAK